MLLKFMSKIYFQALFNLFYNPFPRNVPCTINQYCQSLFIPDSVNIFNIFLSGDASTLLEKLSCNQQTRRSINVRVPADWTLRLEKQCEEELYCSQRKLPFSATSSHPSLPQQNIPQPQQYWIDHFPLYKTYFLVHINKILSYIQVQSILK